MIPKKIHYCWLSGEPFPEKVQECILSWEEKLPDYEIKLWDINSFDVNSVDFVREAISVKKWAFAADYIRLYALYTEGGIYLDSDVFVQKSFDELLNNDFFTAVEYHPECVKEKNTLSLLNEDGSSKKNGEVKPGIGIQAAVIGSIKNHPYLKEVMTWYNENHFILHDGSLNNKIIAPDVLAIFAERFGFKFKNEEQHLKDNMLVLPSNFIAGDLTYDISDNTIALHLSMNGWRPKKKNKVITFLGVFLKKILGVL